MNLYKSLLIIALPAILLSSCSQSVACECSGSYGTPAYLGPVHSGPDGRKFAQFDCDQHEARYGSSAYCYTTIVK